MRYDASDFNKITERLQRDCMMARKEVLRKKSYGPDIMGNYTLPEMFPSPVWEEEFKARFTTS